MEIIFYCYYYLFIIIYYYLFIYLLLLLLFLLLLLLLLLLFNCHYFLNQMEIKNTKFNRTLADRLFSYQYRKELEDPSKSNREWVSRQQNVVSVLNNEKTRLIGMKPVDAIKQTLVEQGFSQPTKEYEKKLLDVGTKVRYLYESGELEGYQYKGERRQRSTDPIWSVDVYKIKNRYVLKHQPTLYYLDDGPKRSFVFEELQPIQDP